jgi:hypothetical protein
MVTVAGMIATPLLPQGGTGPSGAVERGGGRLVHHHHRQRRSSLGRWSHAPPPPRDRCGRTTIVERVGTATGVPFGRYGYTSALQPQVAHVPAIVPLAWFALGLPARETAHAALGERSTPVRRIVSGRRR